MKRATVASLLGLSPAWLFAIGCANSTDGKSGETHFLCKTSGDCETKFGPHYVCSDANECVLPGDGGAAGGRTGSGGASSGGSGNTENGGSGNTENGGSGNAGTGGSPAGSGGKGSSECAVPSDSTCSVADTCQKVTCGGVNFDERGCLRIVCAEDRDCPTDERCTLSMCDNTAPCQETNGECVCADVDCAIGHRCNPVESVGPRGNFVSLDVVFTSGPCPTPMGCSANWHITPDGKVKGRNQTTPVDLVLSPADQTKVTNWVDGPELRPALEKGLPCMNDQITDVDLELTLTLSTGTFSKHANGCFGTENVLKQIYDLFSHL